MNPKKVIGIFFLGLLFMLILEISLVWVLGHVDVFPTFDLSWLNDLFGLGVVAVGGIFVIWSVRIQYTEGKGTPYPKVSTKKLVTTGPYAYTRNPMTLGAALFYLGVAIWLGSVAMIGLLLLIFSVLLTYIYFHETRELAARFGEEYLEYMRKTPFLIPRMTKYNLRRIKEP